MRIGIKKTIATIAVAGALSSNPMKAPPED
jgi:hypothetical protein